MAHARVEPPDKAAREAAMMKLVEAPRVDPSTPGGSPMPFDGKRVLCSGFKQLVDVKV